ncbi:hypothetical protein AVEN_9189-1 [Araneus ventricosus]|uniref:Uncharacterized protein n=1 Tax=Araneus ventricosus TaxID=182803 RepID=A0A4Y2JQV1_ARAVE|nr:hypothetical protein AVEN_9189-1 [Araneus ventricosus]
MTEEIAVKYLRKRLQNIADNADRKAHNLYLNHTQVTPNAGYVDYEDEETDCSLDISEVDLNLYTYKPSTSNRLISLTDSKHKQLTPFVSKSSQMRLGRPSIAVVGDSFGALGPGCGCNWFKCSSRCRSHNYQQLRFGGCQKQAAKGKG